MEWECSHSISLYFFLHCSALELSPTQFPHCHWGANRIISSSQIFGYIYIVIDLQYVSGHIPLLAFMYSIISTKEFYSPSAKFELGHDEDPAGRFSLHMCSFHGAPVSRISRVHFHTNQCSNVQLIISQQGHSLSEDPTDEMQDHYVRRAVKLLC